MNIKKYSHTLFAILSFLIIATACNRDIPISSQEIDQITLEIIDRSELPEGIAYTIKLTNSSKHTIKQNNVYISYPFKIANGTKGNDFKVEAKNNKLNIKPDEEIILSAFTPIEEYEGNTKLNTEECYLEIKGYIDEMKEENYFGKTHGTNFRVR